MTESLSARGRHGLHDAMAARVAAGEMPGLVTVLARGDEVHVDAIGSYAFDDTVPMRRDTLFRIASLTKPVLATATMLLVEDGTLDLTEPVDRLLPELADRAARHGGHRFLDYPGERRPDPELLHDRFRHR